MEKPIPYLSFSYPYPGPTSFLFKKAAALNAEHMRTLSIAEHREAGERLADVRVISPGSRIQPAPFSEVPCEWVYRDDSPPDKAVLYLHGGSWAYGSLRTARPVGMMLGAASGYRVLVAEYRLAPEHAYPAAAEDCVSAYRWLLNSGFLPENIGVFGDSAGGNLALSLLHRIIAQGYPLPAAVGLASPVTDLTEESELLKHKSDLLYAQYAGKEWNIIDLYCGAHDRKSPLLSPVRGDLSLFPPMLIHVGQDEELCIDCDRFARKAHGQGVPVALKIWKGMFHDFTIVGPPLRESRRSIQEFGDFFRQHLH